MSNAAHFVLSLLTFSGVWFVPTPQAGPVPPKIPYKATEVDMTRWQADEWAEHYKMKQSDKLRLWELEKELFHSFKIKLPRSPDGYMGRAVVYEYGLLILDIPLQVAPKYGKTNETNYGGGEFMATFTDTQGDKHHFVPSDHTLISVLELGK